LDIPLIDGRFFEPEMLDDTIHRYIVNEAAVTYLELDDAIGTKLDASIFGEPNGEIIGVVNDFHFFSLHNEVEPLVFMYWPNRTRYMLVEVNEKQKDAVQAHIHQTWMKYNEGHYMHYTYLEEKMNSLYANDRKMLSIFIYFSIFVIFISSLGLYGLSSFLIEQRIKEIGIRRVLGGSENQITLLLAKDYLRLVLIAGLIASPFVYYLMNSWLQSFAYSISISGWYFLFGILITMAFAFLTVLIRSYNAIRQSPALALKYE
jgi:putative ABC transport system permease protein